MVIENWITIFRFDDVFEHPSIIGYPPMRVARTAMTLTVRECLPLKLIRFTAFHCSCPVLAKTPYEVCQ
jgi:hypothetical protein